MSGGYFDYKQYAIDNIADDIENLVKAWEERPITPVDPNDPGEYTYKEAYVQSFEEQTINEFRAAVVQLRLAAVYAGRVDYLLSGDDSEKSFHKRLKEDIKYQETFK
jgi:hypothetical protein